MPQDLRDEIVLLLPRLVRFAHALTGSKVEAEDVAQTAIERALSRLHQFTPGTRLDSWMFRIVHSVAIDGARRRRRVSYVDPTTLTDTVAVDPRIAESTAARADLKIVQEAMAELPEDQRAVLTMVALEGYSYQDTADMLDIPIGTVMSRLSRARRKLADALERPSHLPRKGG